jgi:arylsulfatase A
VPCIMRWPGQIPATQVSTEQVSSLDLFPTLLKLAGANQPNDRAYDGTDIWPVITEQAVSPHDYYFYFWIANLQGVRDQDWKLIFRQEAGDETLAPRLFNLKQDPYEIFNLAEQYPAVVDRLWGEMQRFGAEAEAKLPEWER